MTTATATIETERRTYEGWRSAGRQVKRGERRGFDRMFSFAQTKAIGKSSRRGTCASCGTRINYGTYCGKCEYS